MYFDLRFVRESVVSMGFLAIGRTIRETKQSAEGSRPSALRCDLRGANDKHRSSEREVVSVEPFLLLANELILSSSIFVSVVV